jgi:hypothetical protein
MRCGLPRRWSISGNYVPFVNPDVYREVTPYTTTPIHTGEQIYLRQNYKPLIESHAVNVVGPDPGPRCQADPRGGASLPVRGRCWLLRLSNGTATTLKLLTADPGGRFA